jgi:hypothetical protein
MTLLVKFDYSEIKILEKYNVDFMNNERLYVYFNDNKQFVLSGGSIARFECDDFNWKGSSWKKLLEDFSNWFIKKSGKSTDDLLLIRFSSNGKPIFSKTKESNCYGPLINNLFVHGNPSTSNLVWRKILDLVNLLPGNFKTECKGYVHYPSALEPEEIYKLIWRKELRLFKDYLHSLKYSLLNVEKQVETVQYLNTKYRKISPSYYFFIIDRKADLYNAIYKLKLKTNELDYGKLLPVIENIVSFKKDIYYEDAFYSSYTIN